MKYIPVAAILILCGFLAGYSLRSRTAAPAESGTTASMSAGFTGTPALPAYVQAPPAEALTGTVEKTAGTVLIFPRTGDEPHQATAGSRILQDDVILASPSSAATVSFGTEAELTLGPAGKVTFVQLLPRSFLLWQRQGGAAYTAEGDIPVSVRVRDGLFTLHGGEAAVGMDEDGAAAHFSIASGSATLSQVDAANETQVVSLSAGSTAVLDSELQRIRVIR